MITETLKEGLRVVGEKFKTETLKRTNRTLFGAKTFIESSCTDDKRTESRAFVNRETIVYTFTQVKKSLLINETTIR